MLVRPLPSDRTIGTRYERRRGTAIVWLVLSLFVIVAIQLLVFKVLSLRHRQEELQLAADAGVLAGANALVDEELLSDHDDRHQVVLQRARKAARRYFRLNKVDGQSLGLKPNQDNCPKGELLFGRLDAPRSHHFDTDLDQPDINAVRIEVRRTGAAAEATAYVDRDVVGFKPQGRAPLPVMPLAVLTDPLAPPESADQRSWDYQILARRGTFEWFINPKTNRPQEVNEEFPVDDRIPEMKVYFLTGANDNNGRALKVGVDKSSDVMRQVNLGIAREDLQPLGGQLLLGDQQESRNQLFLPRLQLTKEDLQELAQALSRLVETGERRAWMLYSSKFDRPLENGVKLAGVLGFVAAQVMDVRLDKKSGALCVVLQPGMRITATAVTDAARRHLGPRSIVNPYLCKVRLVE